MGKQKLYKNKEISMREKDGKQKILISPRHSSSFSLWDKE